MSKLKELREQRGKIVKEMRDIVDLAENDNRSLTDEENSKHGELFDKAENIANEIRTHERQEKLDREMAAQAVEKEEKRQEKSDKTPDELRMAGFRSYLRNGSVSGEGAQEFRALQADNDTEGGYLVAPEQFVQQLIKNVDDMVFMRGMATVFSVPNATSLGVPTLDTDPNDADWTSELATGSEDTAMRFGKRELNPHPLAKRIKISDTLLRKSLLPIETIVNERLAYKYAITQEKAFLTGTGNKQPLGVFTASADGISTSRDVSTGNSTTEIKFDGLIEAKYSLKGQYWNNASWMFHRDALKQISKLKDGEGQYIWRESVRDGEPDRILGRPVTMSEYVPNTFTTGQYVGMLGDYSHYWIADALDMTVKKLVELYAETNQTGFIGRLETDGMPVLQEAFTRVKLA